MFQYWVFEKPPGGAAFFKSDSAVGFETWSGCASAKSVVSCLWRCQQTAGGWPLHPGGDFLPPPVRGGGAMVTYSDLFQFCLVVIGIIGLVLQITKKK